MNTFPASPQVSLIFWALDHTLNKKLQDHKYKTWSLLKGEYSLVREENIQIIQGRYHQGQPGPLGFKLGTPVSVPCGRTLRDRRAPACSGWKLHSLAHPLRLFTPAFHWPGKFSCAAAHELATTPQTGHSFCDLWAFAHAVPTFPSLQTKLKSHFPCDALPESPRGRGGALFPTPPSHFLRVAVFLLCLGTC